MTANLSHNGLARWLKSYTDTHHFDPGSSDCETVLDQLYEAYFQSHESDPQEIRDGFQQLDQYLESLPLKNNNDVFTLVCHLCSAYEKKAFIDGLKYGAHLMKEICGKQRTAL